MQLKPDKPGVAEVASEAKPPLHRDRIALGMAASAASFFMLNTMNVFAKLLSPNHSVIEVAFYRNAIAVAPFAVWIFLLGRRDLLKINSRPDAIVLRSVVGTISLVATFKAFNFLPMADAQALFFTSSLFLPVMGWLFLKERVGSTSMERGAHRLSRDGCDSFARLATSIRWASPLRCRRPSCTHRLAPCCACSDAPNGPRPSPSTFSSSERQ